MFSRSGGHKTKETYPTRLGSPTPCKQGLKSKYFNEQYFCKTLVLFYSLISRLISLCHTDIERSRNHVSVLPAYSMITVREYYGFALICPKTSSTFCGSADCHPQSTRLHFDPVGKRNSLYLSHKPTSEQKKDRTEQENKIADSSWPGKNKVFNLTLCGGFSHKKTEVCN